MSKLYTILIFGLVACMQPEKPLEPPKVKNEIDAMSAPMASLPEKKYSLDEIYQTYVSKELLSYIEKTHPAWSLPNENRWYPKLFAKYKTDSSLVNYVSGDFDCDGEKDYALLLDKGNNVLSAVVFLRTDSGFKTVELTQAGSPAEKIEFALTIYKPGRYPIVDPDLSESDSKVVNFECAGVGIGKFKELYDGGNDVYYWHQNNLRSCLIEK